jgi:hypothetical protein
LEAPIKKFIRDLSKGQKLTLLVAVMTGICGIIAVCLTLVGTPLVQWYVDNVKNQQAQELQTITPPTGAAELPSGQSDVFSVVVDTGGTWAFSGGLVTKQLNRTVPSQVINQSDVIRPGSASPRFAEVNIPSTITVLLTGKASVEPVQISNRIPIKLENYRPIPKEIDLVSAEGGGGGDYWFLGTDISKQILSFPEKIAWASYTPDLEMRLKEAQKECPLCFEGYPNEIQRLLSEGTEPLPDYFLLQDKERIAFSVAVFFKDPGIYQLSVGVEYVYGRYKGIAWTEPSIEVYVAENYFVWSCDKTRDPTSPECKISFSCELGDDSEYICTNR